jgi:hypothetical protein
MVEPPSDEDLAGFRDRGKMIIVRLAEQASFGDVLVTGLHREGDNLSYIGRVVQIREKQGAFFSDLVLIRHPDEKLRAHANQCFWILCPEDAARVIERYYPKDLFDLDTEEREYCAADGGWRTGFVIREPPKAAGWACTLGVFVEPDEQTSGSQPQRGR